MRTKGIVKPLLIRWAMGCCVKQRVASGCRKAANRNRSAFSSLNKSCEWCKSCSSFDQELEPSLTLSDLATRERPISHEAGRCPSLQPSTLDDLIAPSRAHCVPKIRADLAGVVAPVRHDHLCGSTQTGPQKTSLATWEDDDGIENIHAPKARDISGCALLGIALLCLALGDVALAEDAGPPACGGKILEKCTPNSGDTAWMLTSVALVLMMTIPGLGLFYGGMVRKKNVGDTVMTSFAITCLVTILWAICTYSLAFRAGTPFIGGLDRAFLQGHPERHRARASAIPIRSRATIPETVYICFQLTFAIITPALIAGAFAERMKFSAMLWFIGLWAIFVYAPVAHWVWGPDGFLSSGNADAWVKVLDFAGGTVVHINSGVAGLMCAHHARQAQGHRARRTIWC